MSNIIEGEDFYYNDDGLIVLTAAYHLKRGSCCGSGCLNCPWPPLTPPMEVDYSSEDAPSNSPKGEDYSSEEDVDNSKKLKFIYGKK